MPRREPDRGALVTMPRGMQAARFSVSGAGCCATLPLEGLAKGGAGGRMAGGEATNQAPMRDTVEVSVVVPVLNGAGLIAESLRELTAFLRELGVSAEVLVVDDGSVDETARLVRDVSTASPVPIILHRHDGNRGKGAAVRTGMLAARGRYRVFIDSDMAYPASEIGVILERLRAGSAVVFASRVHVESRYVIRPSFFRYLYTRHLSGRLFNWLVRLLLLPGVSDTQAGLKGFTAESAMAVFSAWAPDGFAFDLAILARARRLGFRLVEVPVVFRYDREPTTVRFLADTLEMLVSLAAVRLRVGHGGAIAGESLAVAAPVGPSSSVLFPSWVVLASLASLLAGVELSRNRSAPFMLPLGLWLAGVVVLLVHAHAKDHLRGVPRGRWFGSGGEAAIVLAITALAAFLRFAALSDTPAFIHHDAASCGLVGQRLLTGAERDPFALVPSWYHFPQLGLLPYALSLELLGTSVLALRLTSAVPGLLLVPLLYFLVRGWFGRLPATVAAVLLATNHVAVHFSRIGLWNIHSLFLGLVAIGALAGGWRRRSAFWLAVAGLCFGLSLHTYTAGRLFFGLGVLAAGAIAMREGVRSSRVLTWLLVGLSFSVVPLASSFVRAPEALSADRERSVNPFSSTNREHLISAVGSSDRLTVLRYQIVGTLRAFLDRGDSSSHYGTRRPMIGAFSLVLFLGGLAFAVARLPDRRFVFLVSWLVFGLVFGGVLAVDPPSFPRLLVVLPVPFILVGVFLGLVWEKARSLGPVLRACAAVLVLSVAVVSLVSNVRGYLRFVARADVAVNEWDVLEALDGLREVRTVFLSMGNYMLGDSPAFELFRDGRRLVTALAATDLPERLEEPTAFIVAPDLRHLGTEITDRFPDLEREVMVTDGRRQLTVYRPAPTPASKTKGGT